MARVVFKQLRFVGSAGSSLAADAVRAFEAANSGLIKLPWEASAGEFSPDVQAAVFLHCPEKHQQVLTEHPGWSGQLILWETAADLASLMPRLMSRLVSGVDRPDPPPAPPPPPVKRNLSAKVGRETAGRRGKGVTTIFDLTISETEKAELAQLLKQKCGTGGTVKEGRIEIQGDHRDRIVAELEKLGYKVKRSGG